MNKTGISPSGNRVVVRPDEIEKVTEGGIIIAETIAERHEVAQATGTLIAVGPDAWKHITRKTYENIEGKLRLKEIETTGYSEPFAEVGERVAFAKYGGLRVQGADGYTYRILNDEDITARVSEDVSFTDIQSRKRVSAA